MDFRGQAKEQRDVWDRAWGSAIAGEAQSSGGSEARVLARWGVDVIELSLLWGDTVISVSSLEQVREVFVGEGRKRKNTARLFLPEEVLGRREHRLLSSDESGAVHVHFPSEELRSVRGLTIDARVFSPAVESRSSAADTVEFLLPRGAQWCWQLGDFCLVIRASERGARLPRGFLSGLDTTPWTYWAFSLATLGGALGSLAYFVPPQGLEGEDVFDPRRLLLLQQYMTAAAQREEARPEWKAESLEPGASTSGASAPSAAGESGSLGKTSAQQKAARITVSRASEGRTEEELSLARQQARLEASNFGTIQLLRSGAWDLPLAAWGGERAVGLDETSTHGNMWSGDIGEAIGGNGLSLSGTGEGGGDRGSWIAWGGLPLGGGDGISDRGLGGIGRGREGFGDSTGRSQSTHEARVPRMRTLAVETSGRLPPETIQRTVRQNFGRLRMCYQDGLRRNPSLEGRVSVRFVIGRDGAVSNVGLGESELRDAQVNDCIRAGFYGLSFPLPEAGIVKVTYPLLFSPE